MAAPHQHLAHINPAQLTMTANVRRALTLDNAFLDSIRDNGILQPIIATQDASGTLTIRYGHRRTAAAVELGLDTVPVVIIETTTTGNDSDEIDRITTQLAENDHRADITTTDRVAAIEQLAAFGISPAQIAKRTKTARDQVDAALTIAKSPAAQEVLPQLSIEDAAVFAEFEGDENALTQLREYAGHPQFAHRAQRLRDDRDDRAAAAAAAAELAEHGITVLDQRPHDGITTELSRLGENSAGIDPATHTACPGHAAYLTRDYITVLTATGEELTDDQLYDPDTNEQRYTEDDLTERTIWTPQYVCTNPIEHGHPMPAWMTRRANTNNQTSEADPEAQRQQRREVIENNKAWRSAETVRRAWLADYLTRKTLPKKAGDFTARALLTDPYLTTGHKVLDVARDILTPGKDGTPHQILTKTIDTASDNRTHVLTFGLILAAYEAATDVHTWRNPDNRARRYLTFLTELGYTLSAIERIAAGITPEQQEDPDTE